MADTKAKEPETPHRLNRIRVCGRWQKPGYVADAAEKKAWGKRCKDRGLDQKTGKPLVDNTAPTQKAKEK